TLLRHATAQARDGRAMRAVHLELHELVTVDTHRTGGVDLSDDVLTTRTGDLEDSVSCVVGRGAVLLALLVPAGGDVGDGLGGHGLHRAEDALEYVVPVAEHVGGHPAAVLGPIVPAGPLRRLHVTFEHPVAEFPAQRQDAPEEAL